MKRLRILLSAYACRPGEGSESGSGWGWATHLAQRGLDVHVLTSATNRAAVLADSVAGTLENLTFTFVDSPVDASQEGRSLHYVRWQMAMLPVARQLHSANPFDLAHHVTYGSIHVPTPLWRLGIPTFFGPVGGGQTAPLSMMSYFKGSRVKELLRSAQTLLLRASPAHHFWMRKMSCVFATNDETLALARQLGARRVCLSLDTGLPEEAFARSPRVFRENTGPIRLLWTGRMIARKALSLTLDGLAAANRGGVVATLTVVGDGLPPAMVREMIRSRGLDDAVTWVGRLPWSDVQTAYREHDGFLFTSLRDSFGSQHLEAMANGLPLIHLNLHGARTFVPAAAAIKVDVRGKATTVRDIGLAIRKFAGFSAEERNNMSAAGWEAAKAFSWKNRACRAERMYREVLAAEGHGSTAGQTRGHMPALDSI